MYLLFLTLKYSSNMKTTFVSTTTLQTTNEIGSHTVRQYFIYLLVDKNDKTSKRNSSNQLLYAIGLGDLFNYNYVFWFHMNGIVHNRMANVILFVSFKKHIYKIKLLAFKNIIKNQNQLYTPINYDIKMKTHKYNKIYNIKSTVQKCKQNI